MRMSKESKRGKEEKERKLKTFENEKFNIVSQSLLHWNTQYLMFYCLHVILFYIGNFMFSLYSK